MSSTAQPGAAPNAGPRRLYVGVDAGGTKTLAVVVDPEGVEVARGSSGSGNQAAVGLERAMASIHAAAEEAVRAAGGTLPVEAAWFGASAVDRPSDFDVYLPRLSPIARRVRLTNDGALPLSALEGAVGVAVIAGTGSITIGRDSTGAETRAGGWGHIVGDEGSAYELGRAAIQACCRAADGRGEATSLLPAILAYWDLLAPEDLIGKVYPHVPKDGIAALSRLVLTEAEGGDRRARSIASVAAHEIAISALAVGSRLNFPDGKLPLALTGGLLVGSQTFRQAVLRRVRARRPTGQVEIVHEPALSAARAAAQPAE